MDSKCKKLDDITYHVLRSEKSDADGIGYCNHDVPYYVFGGTVLAIQPQ